MLNILGRHTTENIWKVVPPFTNPTNWTIVKTDSTSGLNTSGFEHYHMINYDPFSGAIYASNGDDAVSTKIWESLDDGVTWVPVVQNSVQNGRVCNLIFTRDYIYWGSDEPSLPVLNRVPRKLEGGQRYGDFSVIAKLTDLPLHHATYATVLLNNPPGLLLLERYDEYYAGLKLSVPFWSFDTNSLHIIKKLSPHPLAVTTGDVANEWVLGRLQVKNIKRSMTTGL